MKVGKKKRGAAFWLVLNNNPQPKVFSKHISIPTRQNQGFQITPQDKPLFFLEDSIRKPRLIIWAVKQSKLLDSERKGFPTNSQWADIYYLSSLPCSVQLLERVPSFILPENLVVSGMRKYPTRLCQVSPCVQALNLSLQIRKKCSGWVHGTVTTLTPSPPGSSPCLPTAIAAFPSPAHQSDNAESWHWLFSLSRASAEPNLQIRVSHLLPQSILGMLNTINERCMLT